MTKPIEFYFDFASSYGFLAVMQIDALPRPIIWRPFLLGAVYKTFGQSPLDHPLKRDYIIKVDAPRMARRIGLDLKVPAGFPEHALPPSRVFYWIERQDPVRAVAFAKAAYRKYWLEGCATSDKGVAAEAAASIGFGRDAVLAGMQSVAVKRQIGPRKRGGHPQRRLRIAVLPCGWRTVLGQRSHGAAWAG